MLLLDREIAVVMGHDGGPGAGQPCGQAPFCCCRSDDGGSGTDAATVSVTDELTDLHEGLRDVIDSTRDYTLFNKYRSLRCIKQK